MKKIAKISWMLVLSSALALIIATFLWQYSGKNTYIFQMVKVMAINTIALQIISGILFVVAYRNMVTKFFANIFTKKLPEPLKTKKEINVIINNTCMSTSIYEGKNIRLSKLKNNTIVVNGLGFTCHASELEYIGMLLLEAHYVFNNLGEKIEISVNIKGK